MAAGFTGAPVIVLESRLGGFAHFANTNFNDWFVLGNPRAAVPDWARRLPDQRHSATSTWSWSVRISASR